MWAATVEFAISPQRWDAFLPPMFDNARISP